MDDDKIYVDRLQDLPTLAPLIALDPKRFRRASNPEEALRVLKEQRFDLVIADFKFPDGNNASRNFDEFPVCEHLERTRTPVIMFSLFVTQPVGLLNIVALINKAMSPERMEGVLRAVFASLRFSNGVDNPRELAWLHVSDFHFGAPGGARQDRRVVQGAFLEDIKAQCAGGARFDRIFVTGDIAWAGKPSDYVQATEFFEKLLALTSLDESKLHFVPGNHDVDLDEASATVRDAVAAKPIDSHERLGERLGDPLFLASLRQSFAAYDAFVGKLLPSVKLPPHLGFEVTDPEQKLAFLGFSSAFGSGLVRDAHNKPLDQGALFLDEEHLLNALDRYDSSWLRVVLMHHPPFWLADWSARQVTALLHRSCDLLLHGHLHVSDFQRMVNMRGSFPVVASGSLFQGRGNINSYNVATLNLSTASLEVWYRRYSETQRAFVKDLDSTGDELDGRYAAAFRYR